MRFTQAAVLALVSGLAYAVSSYEPTRPPAVPLAVRSPYLNVWLNGPEGGSEDKILAGSWPRFWTTSIQGWQGYIRVDGIAYNWIGNHGNTPLVNQTNLRYTSTRSVFTSRVGDAVELELEFLSPVFPEDLKRQSITSSYLEVSVRSLDGQSHDVQIYADVSGEFASGDKGASVNWEQSASEGILYHKFYREVQDTFQEFDDQASWGNWYWAIGDTGDVTFQIGADTDVRKQFLDNGKLPGTIDQGPRAVNDRWPVFAFARDLGAISGEDQTNTLFTIGYTQEEAILFQGAGDEPQRVPSLWKEWFTEEEVLSFFFNDYEFASQASDDLDKKIADDSIAAGGEDYHIITSLGVRQVFGAFAYTGTEDDVLVFQKEISSASVVQTVDVLYPTFPIMLYLNPELIKWNLQPLLENQENGKYPHTYSMHDLGRYPRATGHPDGNDEPMPLEESANMIIMMLLYAQRSGNTDYLKEHWGILEQWAQYLIEDAKIPADQLSTDDFAGPLANQTNLAIKGIIGLRAMVDIAELTGNTGNQTRYSDLANEYFEFWTEHGINTGGELPHSMLGYDRPDTYGLLYNIFADRALGLNFIPQSVYDQQSDFYLTKKSAYGVILDTRNVWTKLDWELFAAAVAKPETREFLISAVAKWIGETPTWRAYTDLYDANTGGYPSGIQFTARPVIGGSFALLAL